MPIIPGIVGTTNTDAVVPSTVCWTGRVSGVAEAVFGFLIAARRIIPGLSAKRKVEKLI